MAWRRWIPVLIYLLSAEACLAQDSAAKARAQLTATMRTEHFTVHYDPKDPYLAKLMAGIADKALRRISRDLGYQIESNRPFPLYVFPSHLGFIQAGGLEESRFTVGTTSSVGETIAVDASGVFAPADQVLAHEITHAVIFRLLGPNAHVLPLWMNEGIAKYESQETSERDDVVSAEAAAHGELMPLSRLESSFPESRTDLAYAQSASAVRFMIENHGKDSLKILLKELRDTGSFDKAMLTATGRTSAQFIDDWMAEIDRQYFVLRRTRIAAGVGSVVMAALAVIAFLVRRRKMAEAARLWEEEEERRRMRGYFLREDEQE